MSNPVPIREVIKFELTMADDRLVISCTACHTVLVSILAAIMQKVGVTGPQLLAACAELHRHPV